MNTATPETMESPLHLVARFSTSSSTAEVVSAMANMAKLMLQEAANVNAQDADGWYVINLDIFREKITS